MESNPGPGNYAIKKALLASHHQGTVAMDTQQECNVQA